MQIKKRSTKGFIVISLAGEMKAYDAERFESEVSKIVREKREDIIIDFQNLEHISSSGLRALLNIRGQLLKEGRRLLLVSLRGKVLDVFRVSKLLEIFQVHRNLKDVIGV